MRLHGNEGDEETNYINASVIKVIQFMTEKKDSSNAACILQLCIFLGAKSSIEVHCHARFVLYCGIVKNFQHF